MMTKQEVVTKTREFLVKEADKDDRLELLKEKYEAAQATIDRIKGLAENIGTLPTLTKLREFLAAIKELLNKD